MKIGIIGAGFAGLCTAKVLHRAGHDVVVFDKAPDVGGVWSRTRRYPGLATQSPKAQYAFSDFPMPAEFPEWPSGEQVQRYLADYAAASGLTGSLRLDTEIVRAVPGERGWSLSWRGPGATSGTEPFDRLVVANGVFCEPDVPDYPGANGFRAHGGRVVASTAFPDAEAARGKAVLVVGYGKSACDIAAAVSGVAARTEVVARHVLWKMPRRIAGLVNFKALLLTRLGESLFRYVRLRGVEKILHGPANGLRRRMLNSLGVLSVRQYGLKRHGLVPRGGMEDIVKGAVSLVTDGFFDAVADGRIVVHRDRTVARLLVRDGRPGAELDDGSVVAADIVICGTGFSQGVPFFDADVQRELFDERGNFMLYRQILPSGPAGLYFNGYNSSFFSPLNAEAAAMWIAADLAGTLTLPDPARRREAVVEQLAFMDIATGRHHCRGTKIIPFSLHNVDEVLDDLDLNIGRFTRAAHWLKPVDPAAYRDVLPRLLERLSDPAEKAVADALAG
ncbi:NAD(P)/FAD-dependent oxidoreductase [Amycolatopsis sp. WQ 127309]|uniref:flavin-containing monooxygenase n=1 Tax=Amycolatopsis sp. WQ 127309 TaxID=2932773 RepID=UPI001FF2B3E8|nr:NAD(P)/FAD-dependent oxidoreductase [Amycolatopsis sp. WQ 127309]UOZ06961.1 NAD(P)/FAD-dependent oxidoreductase [Amycolatopsis sp. WQ 127309]